MLTEIALVVVQALTPGSFEYAMQQAHECETETSWAEQVAPGVWRGVCGDDEGNELIQSCTETAALNAAIAKGLGLDEDAAYEDAVMLCGEREGFGVFEQGTEGK